jgi:hypothetical protein
LVELAVLWCPLAREPECIVGGRGSELSPTMISTYKGLLGHAFISCASVKYFSTNETAMTAAVLVNASRPGAPPAQQLPGAKPLPGDPGVVRALGSGGSVLAKRVPGGWIVVEEGGTGLQEPTALLEHLTAKIDV